MRRDHCPSLWKISDLSRQGVWAIWTLGSCSKSNFVTNLLTLKDSLVPSLVLHGHWFSQLNSRRIHSKREMDFFFQTNWWWPSFRQEFPTTYITYIDTALIIPEKSHTRSVHSVYALKRFDTNHQTLFQCCILHYIGSVWMSTSYLSSDTEITGAFLCYFRKRKRIRAMWINLNSANQCVEQTIIKGNPACVIASHAERINSSHSVTCAESCLSLTCIQITQLVWETFAGIHSVVIQHQQYHKKNIIPFIIRIAILLSNY